MIYQIMTNIVFIGIVSLSLHSAGVSRPGIVLAKDGIVPSTLVLRYSCTARHQAISITCSALQLRAMDRLQA